MSTPYTRKSLTPDKIVDKALEIADAQGFEALSMRKLAGALGSTAMSLYNHVANKDALLELMLERVAAEILTPDINGDWEATMRKRAHSMRAALLRHRWVPPLLISTITMGAASLRNIDATVGCLVTQGFTYAEADWARNALDSHVYGYTLQELNYPVSPEAYQTAAAQYLPLISKDDYPFMREAAVQIVDGTYDGMTQFSFGLELIIDGLKRWRDSA